MERLSQELHPTRLFDDNVTVRAAPGQKEEGKCDVYTRVDSSSELHRTQTALSVQCGVGTYRTRVYVLGTSPAVGKVCFYTYVPSHPRTVVGHVTRPAEDRLRSEDPSAAL